MEEVLGGYCTKIVVTRPVVGEFCFVKEGWKAEKEEMDLGFMSIRLDCECLTIYTSFWAPS